MGGCALLAGAAGYVLGRLEALVLVDRLASQVPRARHARFLADGAAHLTSYLVGFVGGLVVIVRVWRSRRPPGAPDA